MSAMKAGTEDKKKLYTAVGFGVFAVAYLAWTFVGSGDSGSAPSVPSATVPPPVAAPAAAGRPAQATARIVPSKMDPVLHPEGMLLAERVTYTGSGRNIFLPGAPPVQTASTAIPKPVQTARYVPPPPPVNMGPPPPPPINLKFFGTATLHDGRREVFLLQGDDVFVAKTGDIVGRRYKVGQITASQVEITDMTNNNTQRLPITAQ